MVSEPKMEENAQGDEKKHFVLVHGGCHGSWCWYKLQPKLISAGHRVSSLNMASSGISPKPLNQIHSISSYFDPLIKFMESLPPQERVFLVGHSYGGHAISKAMENFPEKISVAIFITARMPGPNLSVPDLMRDYAAWSAPPLDNQYSQGTVNPMKSFIFGPKYLAANVYQLCSPEDLTLAIMLVSPMRIFSGEHISNEIVLTRGGTTAKLVAKYRPAIPILSVVVPVLTTDSFDWTCSDETPARHSLIYRGLIPLLAEGSAKATDAESTEVILEAALKSATTRGLCKPGDAIVALHRIGAASVIKICVVK